ncbi:hypothetical protein U1Q18_016460 [Sarracenia purpurea var. burkii]
MVSCRWSDEGGGTGFPFLIRDIEEDDPTEDQREVELILFDFSGDLGKSVQRRGFRQEGFHLPKQRRL